MFLIKTSSNINVNRWTNQHIKRRGLSVRRATNIKGTSVSERRHRIENYHCRVQFGMRLDPISSESESDSESGQYSDTMSDDSGRPIPSL